jgi:hypothetical protein
VDEDHYRKKVRILPISIAWNIDIEDKAIFLAIYSFPEKTVILKIQIKKKRCSVFYACASSLHYLRF